MAISTNGIQLVRLAGAVFNQQLSAADYSEILAANKTAADLNAWANSAVALEFRNKTTTDIAKAVLANVGLSSVAGLEAWLAAQLTAGGGVAKAGETMLTLLNDFSNMSTSDATYGSAVSTFNTKTAASQVLSQTAGTATGTYAAVSSANTALTLTSATQTSNGTAGDDTFTAAAGTWGAGDVVNGGAGTDTLNATITGTGPTQSATSLVSVEVLNLTASPNPATLDLTGVTGLTQVNNVSSANGATLSVTGLGNVVNTTITGGNTSTSIAYTTAAVAGTTDAATVSLKGTAAGSTFTTSGVETLTINSGTAANTLTSLSASGMTKLVVTGDQALTIGGTAGNSGTGATATYDLSAATGALTLTTGNGTGTSSAGVTVTGPTSATAGALTLTTGSNNDTVTLGAGANTVSTGAGNDTITSGGGANTITPGTGNDTVNLGAGVDTVRFAEVGATNADTLNNFGSNDVIAVNIGAAAVTGTNAAAASANAAFGVVPTGATSPVLQNVAGTATANAVVFQAIAPNATATVGTVAGTSNVIALNGAYTDGTAAGVISALGTSATTGIATTPTGKFLLVTYSVGNIAQVWSFAGDTTVDTDITAAELSLVATLNGVALNGLTAANFSTYLTPVTATTTVSNTGQTVNLTGTLNTVLSTANNSGQYLTAAADTINVGVGTLPTGAATATSGLTIIDPGVGDADVLNATVLGNWAAGSVISGIETINLNMLVAGTTFSASAITPGTTTFGLTGTQNFTATALPNGAAVTLGSGYTGTANVSLVSDTGAADSLVVNLAGSVASSASVGASLEYVQVAVNTANVIETATVNVTAASSIRTTGNDLFATNDVDAGGVSTAKVITATSLAGSGNLTIYGTAANLDTLNLNGSGVGYTGALTLRPSTNAAMDFSASGVVTGISTIDLQDVNGFSNAITLAGTNTTNTSTPVTISFAPTTASGNTTIGGMTISKTGGTQSDVVTLSLGANAASVASGGTLTATTIETLNINSSRASTGTLTLGAVTLTDGPGTQTVKVTSASTVAAGTITADTVDFSGVTGAVTGVTLANTAGVSFIGGSGNTVVTGSSSADLITTGAGTDTIIPAGGADVITTGGGFDTVQFAVSAATANVAPSITDFTVGTTTTSTDIFGISQGNTFGAAGNVGFAAGTGAAGSLAATALGSLVVQSIATSNGAAAVTANASVFKLTSTTAGTGADAQTVFNNAIGTSTVTGLTGGTEFIALVYDATAGRALVLDVDASAGAGATTLQTADTVRVIGTLVMSATDYANFGVNNLYAY